MWEQYKKSFVGMQLVIVLVTAAAFLGLYRAWQPAAQLFVILQIAAFTGAYWATRIRKRFPSNV
jgi:hypothetical protein